MIKVSDRMEIGFFFLKSIWAKFKTHINPCHDGARRVRRFNKVFVLKPYVPFRLRQVSDESCLASSRLGLRCRAMSYASIVLVPSFFSSYAWHNLIQVALLWQLAQAMRYTTKLNVSSRALGDNCNLGGIIWKFQFPKGTTARGE